MRATKGASESMNESMSLSVIESESMRAIEGVRVRV